MNTLLIRLIGPMQSWGMQSQFGVRDTATQPSKSGVIGLLCAALGRPRAAPLEDLASLSMGVRIDREGILKREFQTIQTLDRTGKVSGTQISNRYYLADTAFLVGFEGADLTLLESLHLALAHPHWLLYLGRRAFPPTAPPWLPDGLKQDQNLLQALRTYPCLVNRWNTAEPPKRLRTMVEDPEGELSLTDVPISFQQRTFTSRWVIQSFIPCPPIPEEGSHVSFTSSP